MNSIPEDLQIIGMDNTPQADWMSYRLSSFQQDFARLAKEVVKIVVGQIQDSDSSMVKLMIPATLVKRDTLK
nr:substrate-binding domain-containing protein [Vibrio sp. 99-8-1]